MPVLDPTPALVGEARPESTGTTAAACAYVLVIEDDPRSFRLMAAGLSSAGYRIRQAQTAEEAEAILRTERPDLLLCDVCLPGIDGVELTRRLRGNAALAEIPILIVTSLDDRKIVTRSLGAGADDFLTKPINTVELRARVNALLRNKARVDKLRGSDPLPPGGSLSSSRAESAHSSSSSSAAQISTILVVEDQERESRLVVSHLDEHECRLIFAPDVRSARRLLDCEEFDLVLLDLLLPDGSGYDLIDDIRNHGKYLHVPILVLSALTGVEERVKALELGADDFILKGADRSELQARVRRLLHRKRTLNQLERRCDQALQQAVTDGLTGLYTHGYLQDVLQREVATARNNRQSLSLLFLDIDHFKSINDRHGHAVGDEVLCGVAQTLKGCLRRRDVGVRYGGEEFVVMLPETTSAEAIQVAERIRLSAETLSIRIPDRDSIRLTVSIGVADLTADGADAATLLQRADEAMYRAKRAGRNQVVAFLQDTTTVGQARILLVDDEDRNLRLLEAYLAPEGYTLLKASSGAEALEAARRERPDLVLLDGMMPQLTGFEVCRRLKQETATSLIPVVLVTALSGREDRLRGIEAGADDFLTKPVDRIALIARTRALLRAKRGTDSLEDAEVVIFTLAKAVENRDSSTGGHVERVSHYAVALGRAIGLTPAQIDGLRRAGIVHDIGKVAIPDAILLKPGKLTPEERVVMQSHAEIGYEMLRPMRTFQECLPAVRFHHERLDGSGYPLGLQGAEVPLTAQIMGIVDVFDALTTDRIYRPAMTYQEALEILRTEVERGLHDAQLFAVFEKLISEQALNGPRSEERTPQP